MTFSLAYLAKVFCSVIGGVLLTYPVMLWIERK